MVYNLVKLRGFVFGVFTFKLIIEVFDVISINRFILFIIWCCRGMLLSMSSLAIASPESRLFWMDVASLVSKSDADKKKSASSGLSHWYLSSVPMCFLLVLMMDQTRITSLPSPGSFLV